MNIKSLEKTELHCHLGSMVSPHNLWEIAHTQGLKLPTKDYHEFVSIIQGTNEDRQISHKDYLLKFDLTQKIQSSPLAIETSVQNAISMAYIKDNTTTFELRFNPMLRNNDGYYDVDSVISHACIGLQKACLMYPVKAGLIISTDRSFSPEKSEVLASKASEFKDKGVVGFDMSGGSFKEFDIKKFVKAFRVAKESGLGITIHTGEVKSVDLTETHFIIDNIFPDRIGHGVRSIEDKNLMSKIADYGIKLEICPSSNVKTSCVSGIKDFKKIFKTFNKHNIEYSINTDGHIFLNTSMNEEYNKLLHFGSISEEEIININEKAKSHSFIKQ